MYCCSKLFRVDLVALLPLDYAVVWLAARHGGDLSTTALNYFQLFRLLRMVKSYPPDPVVCEAPSHQHLTFLSMLPDDKAHWRSA